MVLDLDNLKRRLEVNQATLINAQEMAAILKVPVSWVYQRTGLGQDRIPHLKIGKYIRFDPAEVLNFYKQRAPGRN
jgi:hypothetical protein